MLSSLIHPNIKETLSKFPYPVQLSVVKVVNLTQRFLQEWLRKWKLQNSWEKYRTTVSQP